MVSTPVRYFIAQVLVFIFAAIPNSLFGIYAKPGSIGTTFKTNMVKNKNSNSGPIRISSAIPVDFIYSSALKAMARGPGRTVIIGLGNNVNIANHT